ncbi:MAG: mucoidy inhibitor MuiA family protein [Planctomycetes bacterium]|nr:mucoidy inhibitor MuiA family protein [Planctomycetota bacterium]MCP4771756.1 mucoidy inhibitor MuiA family protein [Planctomycetota bacterium]MCP4861001.1 mucoidy inhibitor MuiA family protein [Planctomycetota bacterium]
MITTLLLSLSCSLPPVAAVVCQEPDVPTYPSAIERVTVYPGQALVERVVEIVPTDLGLVNMRIGPLPMSALPTSFQTEVLAGSGVVQGLEMRTRTAGALEWQQSESLQSQVKEALWQHRLLKTDLLGIKAGIDTLTALIDDPSPTANSVGGLPSDPEKRIKFVRDQMTKLSRELATKEREMEQVEAQISDLRAQLDRARAGSKQTFREARIGIHIEQLGTVRMKVTYLVDGAWWTPAYDVRVAPDLTGVNVGLVGQVTQRSGEDWDGVQLVLSTSTPNIGLDPPALPRRYYSVYGEYPRAGGGLMARDNALEELGYVGSDSLALASTDAKAFSPAPTVAVQDFGLSTQFVMPGKTSVRANGEAHRFRIRELPLEVKPERYVVPSMSTNAYLRAEVIHTGDAPLLSGVAKIFLGPDYLGEASFPVLRQGDSTMLNLGIDPNLTVEWETLEDSRDNPGRFSFGSTATISRNYRATLHLSAAARGRIKVLVEEPLPMSWDDRIGVEIGTLQPTPVETEEDMIAREERGVYRWRLTMAPGSTQAVRWGYDLSFDEDLEPYLQEN